MTNEAVAAEQRVSVTFKRSSTKDGGEGYDIYVGEGATPEEAERVMELAVSLRNQALEALKPKAMIEQLEESLR